MNSATGSGAVSLECSGRGGGLTGSLRLVLILTLMLAGRAMTLAFLGRVGGSGDGDPPLAWTMPLWGDAVIGLLALPAAYLIWKRTGLFAWALLLIWNAVAIWDALSAFVVHLTVPWPTFFMIETFGASMFFAASAMHGVCIYLLCQPLSLRHFLGGTIWADPVDLAGQFKAGT